MKTWFVRVRSRVDAIDGIRPDTHAVYAAIPGSKSEIEDILFQELPTKIDDNRW